jgi:hypothetical protein
MKRLDRLYNWDAVAARKRGEPIRLSASCMVPQGRASFTIYAVALKEHPGVVKVGQTSKWASRLQSYRNWNLCKGDAVERATRFVMTDAFVDLRKLEAHILAAVGQVFPIHYGSEWFSADYDEVVRLIDRTLAESGLTYDIE